MIDILFISFSSLSVLDFLYAMCEMIVNKSRKKIERIFTFLHIVSIFQRDRENHSVLREHSLWENLLSLFFKKPQLTV